MAERNKRETGLTYENLRFRAPKAMNAATRALEAAALSLDAETRITLFRNLETLKSDTEVILRSKKPNLKEAEELLIRLNDISNGAVHIVRGLADLRAIAIVEDDSTTK